MLVEIKARFDEQANIRWARKLEQAGCHVVYGLVGLKTHCKLALVVRDEPDGHPPLRPHRHRQLQPEDRADVRGLRPAHRRTRASARTSRTCSTTCPGSRATRPTSTCWSRRTRCATGCSSGSDARGRAPRGRPARRGSGSRPTRIVDEAVIDELYRASQAGVPVDLLVRGICALRPGRPGLSENIRVRSVLGRFLEHSRVFWFENGGEPEVWIGSADLMHRNLDRRVEVPGRPARPEPGRRGRPAARPGLRRRHGVVVARPGRRLDPAPRGRRRRAAARPAGGAGRPVTQAPGQADPGPRARPRQPVTHR